MYGYDAVVASLRPIAWWKLADPVGSTTAVDSSGSGYTGTVHGGVTFGEPGPIAGTPNGTAALFDGSTGYISTSAVALESLVNAGDFTFMAWVNPTSTPPVNAGCLSIPGTAALSTAGIDFDGAGHVKWDYFFTDITSSAVVPNNAWSFICCLEMRAAQLGAIYVDGVLNVSGGMPAPIVEQPPQIGAGVNGTQFPGLIAEAAIFVRALTAAEIAALWQAAQ